MRTLTSHAARMAAFFMGLAILVTVPSLAQGNAREQAQAAVKAGDFTTAARLYEDAIKAAPKDKGVLVEAGDVNMVLERYTVARDLYRRSLDISSSDENVQRKYGIALSASGEHSRAIEVLAELNRDEESLENSLALGNAYLAAGKDSLARAEVTFQSAQRKYPSSAEVAVALGDLYFARQIYPLAQQKYEDALKLDPSIIEPRVRLARSYRELAKIAGSSSLEEANEYYNKALLEFNRVTSLDSTNARAWYEQGEIFMLAQQYEKAATSFQVYTKLRPEDPRGDIMLARSAFDGNFFPQAVQPLERVLGRTDEVSQAFADSARVMIGKSYYAAKDYVKAREAYGLARPVALNQEATKLYVSSILLSGGDTAKAVDMYKKIVDANPTDCDLSGGLGSLLYGMKRYDDVIQVFSNRIANCPAQSPSSAYLFIGLSHFAKNRIDSALVALNRAVETDTSSVQAHFWLMNAYAKKDDFAKAGEVGRLMASRGMDKTNPKEVSTGFFFAGTDRFKAKDYKGAIAEYDRALKMNPENVQAYLYTAFSYQYQSDKDNACKYYNQALKYDPKNADVRKNMKTIGCE